MKPVLAAACCAYLLTATSALAADTSAYDRVMASGTIKCGYGISPPVIVKDPNSGTVSGLDYDIWQEIGKELGVKVEFTEEAGWGNFIEGLKTGRYDAFCSELWPDPGRSKNLSLTIPVMYSFLKTYARADDKRFDGDLDKVNSKDIRVPAVEGDVSVAMVQGRFPEASIVYLPQTATHSEMVLSVTSGKADVVFLDQAMIAGFEKENPGVLREVKNVPPAYTFASYFAVNGGETQLRDMINVALRSIIDDGRMERMAKKYSASYIPPRKNYEAK